MSKEVAEEIDAACWDEDFADEFMEKTILLCWKRNPIRHVQKLASLVSLNLIHFRNARDFAMSFSQRFNDLTADDDTCISPYFAMCIGLARLQDFRGFVVPVKVLAFVREWATEFERGNCTSFGHENFNDIFSDLIDMLSESTPRKRRKVKVQDGDD